jgi:sterol desaturase/sphingolipid hydroxylase (fatty acid hydroxylase superfamily)
MSQLPDFKILSDYWMSSPWLAWGLGPLVGSGVGFFLTFLLIGFMESAGIVSEKDRIVYTKTATRESLMLKTLSKIPYDKQLQSSVWNAVGPPAVMNAVGSSLLMPFLIGDAQGMDALPEASAFLIQFTTMQLVGDLMLYLGHRVQHEVDYLWKNFHSVHHSIDTPNVASTAYIHPMDAFLQAALPIMLAAIIAGAHPISFALYTMCRVAENTVNHSGYDHWLINGIFLKWLPLRASVRHHDEHHRFSNYSGGGKNYGENFFIWDWLFRTLRPSISTSLGRAASNKD